MIVIIKGFIVVIIRNFKCFVNYIIKVVVVGIFNRGIIMGFKVVDFFWGW